MYTRRFQTLVHAHLFPILDCCLSSLIAHLASTSISYSTRHERSTLCPGSKLRCLALSLRSARSRALCSTNRSLLAVLLSSRLVDDEESSPVNALVYRALAITDEGKLVSLRVGSTWLWPLGTGLRSRGVRRFVGLNWTGGSREGGKRTWGSCGTCS